LPVNLGLKSQTEHFSEVKGESLAFTARRSRRDRVELHAGPLEQFDATDDARRGRPFGKRLGEDLGYRLVVLEVGQIDGQLPDVRERAITR